MGRGRARPGAENPHRHAAQAAPRRSRRHRRPRAAARRGDRRRRRPLRAAASSRSSTGQGSACSASSARMPDGGGRLDAGRQETARQGARDPARRHQATPRTATWSRSASQPHSRLGLPTARVEERLGSLKSERAVSLIAIHAHDIPHVFPAAAEAEAEAAQARRRWPAARTGASCRSSPSIRPTPRTTTTRSMPSPITDPDNPRRPHHHRRHRRRRALRAARLGARPRGAGARQLGLFPRPRRADAAGAHLQRSVLAPRRTRIAPRSRCA